MKTTGNPRVRRAAAVTAVAAVAEAMERRTLMSADPAAEVTVSLAEVAGFGPAAAAESRGGFETVEEIVPGGVMVHSTHAPRPLTAAAPGGDAGAGGIRPAGGGFDIVLKRGPNLTANAAATAAFNQAAAFFEGLFSDPITVVIDAEVAPLGAGVIGSTGSESFNADYTFIRDLVVNGRAGDEAIAASIPTAAQFTATVPNNTYSVIGMQANRANLLALGVPASSMNGPNSQYDPTVDRDMSITFSTNFAFDFDRSNGISPGQIDFVAVAIHEIGHGLGFVSEVDYVDFTISNSGASRQLLPTPLDLYRMRPGQGLANFTGNARVLATSGNAVSFDGGTFNPGGIGGIAGLTLGDVPMSTGRVNGDGQQASHWKDNQLTGFQIGLMDPTAAGPGQQLNWLAPDTRAMGLIGWDLAGPSATVAGRKLFYNTSPYDGGSAAANAADDAAIDTAKVALLPGGVAAAANVTSYSRGVNGVMVDVLNLPNDGAGVGLDDVAVRTTTPAAPNTFSAGPAPSSVTVRPGAGTGGSDRVTITWADGANVNRWVEVTLLADAADTGLAAADVFYFGSLVGDVNGDRTVNLADFGAVRADFNGSNLAIPAGRSDFNRDRSVNLADFGALRANFNKSLPALPAAAATSAAMTVAEPAPSASASAPGQADKKRARPALRPADDLASTGE